MFSFEDIKAVPFTGRETRRTFFDQWTRHENTNLLREILGKLGSQTDKSPSHDQDNNLAMYRDFCLLPGIDWKQHVPPLASVCRKLQSLALFSKNEDLESDIDCEKVAFESFLQAEAVGKAFNESFDRVLIDNKDVSAIMHYAQFKAADILGDLPSFEELSLTFGPGASTTCRSKTSARCKLSTTPSISRSSVQILPDLKRALPTYFDYYKNVMVCAGDLEFVPKNYKTHRSINIEPTINGMVQRGYGKAMKQKLSRAGINLYDQTINKQRARKASVDGSLATLDLKAASDSIYSMLILNLLPIDWFDALEKVRTPTVRYQSLSIDLEKFSAMGNGYTFELESLTFYSLAYGISRHFDCPFDLTVYGDDLICNPQLASLIVTWFPFFGLSINTEKSFMDGDFRESCGGDYLKGVDVRPFFLKKRLSSHQLVIFFNFLNVKEWFDEDGEIRRLLLNHIPLRHRLYGLPGYGDGHIQVPNPPLKESHRDRGYSGFTFETFVARPRVYDEPLIGDALLPFYAAALIGKRLEDISSADLRYFANQSITVKTEVVNWHHLRKEKDAKMQAKKTKVYVF